MNNYSIKIEKNFIGADSQPFIIAEMSGNHNQSLERALSIVEAAAKAGVHALKIQTYTPDTMTLDLDEREFHISDPNSLWAGTSLYQLYSEASGELVELLDQSIDFGQGYLFGEPRLSKDSQN